MKVDLDSIKPGYTIRSDVFGFYFCTAAEAEQTDNGSPSAGYDLRSHWQTLEEAVSALQNWKPSQPASREARPTPPTRRPLMAGTASRLAIHSQSRPTAPTRASAAQP